jgi:hypothetical protein
MRVAHISNMYAHLTHPCAVYGTLASHRPLVDAAITRTWMPLPHSDKARPSAVLPRASSKERGSAEESCRIYNAFVWLVPAHCGRPRQLRVTRYSGLLCSTDTGDKHTAKRKARSRTAPPAHVRGTLSRGVVVVHQDGCIRDTLRPFRRRPNHRDQPGRPAIAHNSTTAQPHGG